MATTSQTNVISHWYTLIGNLQASPMEFYASVERAIESRQIPGATTSRVDWYEGGAFSARREYLRVSREKHFFDICGAPFGTGFFVSWWLGEARPSPLGPTLAAVGLTFFSYVSLTEAYGFFSGLFFTFLALVAAFFVLGAFMSRGGEKEWVAQVLVIPVVGPLLERFFLPATHYRIDTALMFQQAIHTAVMEVVDEITKAKGVRALSELERKPILRELFQR